MNSFGYAYPTRAYFGEGALERSQPDELARVDQTVMLAYGGGSIRANGIFDRMSALLRAAGKRVVEFGGIMPDPTYAKVQQGAQLARAEGVDFILAVGGGSVVDCRKIAAAQAVTDEDVWALEFEKRQLPTQVLPLGAVVTASGTGVKPSVRENAERDEVVLYPCTRQLGAES